MRNAREMHRTLEEAESDFDISSVCSFYYLYPMDPTQEG